jgi:phage terminase large subunit
MERIIKLLPNQYKFLKSKKKETLFTGSYGSGKSVALCYKLLIEALKQNNLVLLTRKTRASLLQSTLRTLLIGDGEMSPILPKGSYEHRETKSEIRIFGGGTIVYTGADDPIKIRSMNLGAVGIDEAIELDEDEYLALIGRLRNTATEKQLLFAATNPSSKEHFLYKRFFEEINDDRLQITSTIDDNKYLPKEYVQSIKSYTGTAYKRYAQGIWCTNEGAIYKEFNSGHKINKTLDGFDKFIIGVDIGYSNDPTCILVIGLTTDHQFLHVFEEFVKNNITPSEIVNKINEFNIKYINNVIVIDPSAAGIRMDCEKLGMFVEKANNGIEEGIQRVQELLSKNLITFDNSCANIFKEFDLYSYKEGTDKPIDKFNHSMDALRYGIAYYFDNYRISTKPTIYIPSGEDFETFDDDEW